MRIATILAALLALSFIPAWGENGYVTISATTTADTDSFSTAQTQVTICNFGSDDIHFRLFNGEDTSGAATTNHAKLSAPSGTDPLCLTFPFDNRSQQGLGWVGYSVRAATGTATVDIHTE